MADLVAVIYCLFVWKSGRCIIDSVLRYNPIFDEVCSIYVIGPFCQLLNAIQPLFNLFALAFVPFASFVCINRWLFSVRARFVCRDRVFGWRSTWPISFSSICIFSRCQKPMNFRIATHKRTTCWKKLNAGQIDLQWKFSTLLK